MKIHPVALLFPLLPGEQLRELAESIKKDGLLNPCTRQRDVLLDGRNRLAACEMVGVKPRFVEYMGKDAVSFIVAQNLHRRHLTTTQKAVLALDLEPHFAKRRKETQGTRTDIVANLPQSSMGKARDDAAAVVGVSGRTVQDAKFIKEHSPELINEMRAGNLKLPAAMAAVKKQSRQDNRRKAAESATVLDQIIVGDFRKLSHKIPDGSLALIFTDPPYDRKSQLLFPGLADFAEAKLAVGGSLLFYCGHLQLPSAFCAFDGKLRHWWTCACVHSGNRALMREYGIRVGWKPILWFVKGTRDNKSTILCDTVSGGAEKVDHEWQQAQSEAEYWIEALCPLDGIVCDPFLGGGTTAAAAKRLGRVWVAFEEDKNAAKVASKRLQ
jgi:hypothetical protein